MKGPQREAHLQRPHELYPVFLWSNAENGRPARDRMRQRARVGWSLISHKDFCTYFNCKTLLKGCSSTHIGSLNSFCASVFACLCKSIQYMLLKINHGLGRLGVSQSVECRILVSAGFVISQVVGSSLPLALCSAGESG